MGHGGDSDCFHDMLANLEAGRMDLGFSVTPTRSVANTASSSTSSGGASNNYIEHTVSKLDTLAGIAIKYGVEVSDIKRMNGLMTDLQMFAHKTLHIPLPGRHPPSSALSNNTKTPSSVTSGRPPRYGIHIYCNSTPDSYVPEPKKSEKKPVSVAMSLLRGYYGLSPRQRKGNEGTEMTVYKADNNLCMEGEPSTPPQTYSNGESKDVTKIFKTSYNGDLLMKAEEDFTGENSTRTNGFLTAGHFADAGFDEIEKTNESLVRRRSKVEGMDYLSGSTDNLLKQEAGLSGRGGKGWSLRPKSGSKLSLASDATGATDHPFTVSDPHMADALLVGVSGLKGFGDSPGNGKTDQDLMSKVRRSSSTSSLQDSGKVSPLRSTSRWAAKGDNQGVLTSAVSKPLFEAIPRPLNGRWNKAALD
ncbi:hypothetical protein KI387_018332 [Taxus chinensis]|uniref:LysM domain-containing protein n=1 Tax=Taxus chinensis TaxID=29808 RepID=A0AA38GKL7_TAXCH|nr:hypothetical protein KI387_018332 [Taxus chinensis]